MSSNSKNIFIKKFVPQVRALMAQVDDSELIRPDFDLSSYINKLFPTEQSLAQLDVFMKKFDEEIVLNIFCLKINFNFV